VTAFDEPIRTAVWVLAVATAGLATLALTLEAARTTGRKLTVLARAERFVPAAARRAAAVVIGSTLAATPPTAPPPAVRSWLAGATTAPTTTPATSATTATTATTTATTPPPRRAPVVVTLAPDPGRVATTPPTAPVPTPPTTEPRYRVRPGDCLWTIAARLLPAGASLRTIDRTWRLLYAANRAVIGDDPGLIRPGAVLALPRNVRA